jgi:hypothetical protein
VNSMSLLDDSPTKTSEPLLEPEPDREVKVPSSGRRVKPDHAPVSPTSAATASTPSEGEATVIDPLDESCGNDVSTGESNTTIRLVTEGDEAMAETASEREGDVGCLDFPGLAIEDDPIASQPLYPDDDTDDLSTKTEDSSDRDRTIASPHPDTAPQEQEQNHDESAESFAMSMLKEDLVQSNCEPELTGLKSVQKAVQSEPGLQDRPIDPSISTIRRLSDHDVRAIFEFLRKCSVKYSVTMSALHQPLLTTRPFRADEAFRGTTRGHHLSRLYQDCLPFKIVPSRVGQKLSPPAYEFEGRSRGVLPYKKKWFCISL